MARKRNRPRKPPRTRGADRPDAARPLPVATLPPPANAPGDATAAAPPFWFGFGVAWAKLAITRVVVFTLLAIDSILQIGHASRYGAGNFNVAHLPLLDELGPGRIGFAVGHLACAYLLAFVALGVATRIALPIAATLYAWLYFGSQLDSYQHHYLVALVLGLACFVPWQRPPDATPRTPVRTWAVRLILVQLGVMYLWAAISKMDAAWIDGRTLQLQLTGDVRTMVERTVGFTGAAWLTLVLELVLAVTIWSRRGWLIALPLGVAFHIGIIASGLEIGLFAYLMLGFYLLVVPDRALVAVVEHLPLGRRGKRAPLEASPAIAVAIASLGVGVGVAMVTRLHYARELAIVLAVVVAVVAGAAARRGQWSRVAALGLAHVIAISTWLMVDRASATAVDYYRFWGGSARRFGDLETAERAYTRLRDEVPGEGTSYYQLGRIYLDRHDDVRGLASLHDAQRLEPARARAWIVEARYLLGKGLRAEAIAKLRAAVEAEPAHREARALLQQLTQRAAPAPSPSRPDVAPARAPSGDSPDEGDAP